MTAVIRAVDPDANQFDTKAVRGPRGPYRKKTPPRAPRPLRPGATARPRPEPPPPAIWVGHCIAVIDGDRMLVDPSAVRETPRSPWEEVKRDLW